MSALGRAWYTVCQQGARAVFVTVFGVRVYHRERMPRTGGVLVVANHQSYLDPILAALGTDRPLHPMARESLFRFAPFGWLIRSLNAFPVRRESADVGAIREALRRLKAGSVVLVFPEGTRTRDGSIGRLQRGPVMMAARARVPIMPMVIDGAFEAWPRASLLPLPHRIRVACGRAIEAADLVGAEAEAVIGSLAAEMAALQAELRRLPRGVV